MTTAYCDPNSDVSYSWSDDAATDYTRVNDSVRSPTNPAISGDGELCHAGPNDDNEEAAFGGSEPISSGTVSQIVLYAYMVATSGVSVELRVKLNGTWQSAGTVSVDSTGGWYTKTYSGSWNAATDIFPMQIGIKPLTIGKSDDVNLYAAYVELTYTTGGGGTTHNRTVSNNLALFDHDGGVQIGETIFLSVNYLRRCRAG